MALPPSSIFLAPTDEKLKIYKFNYGLSHSHYLHFCFVFRDFTVATVQCIVYVLNTHGESTITTVLCPEHGRVHYQSIYHIVS